MKISSAERVLFEKKIGPLKKLIKAFKRFILPLLLIGTFFAAPKLSSIKPDVQSSLPRFNSYSTARPTTAPSQNALLAHAVKNPASEEAWLPTYLMINKIRLNIDVEVVKGSAGNWPVPDYKPATADVDSRLGGNSNLAIWGHRGTIFERLGEMQEGDTILASNGGQLRKYRVTKIDLITPNPGDGEVLKPTNKQVLTLITCHPKDIFNERLIITAELVDPNPS